MRGKRTDPEFISDYISSCVQRGIITPLDIAQTAKNDLAEIDRKIKEVEALKVVRSKLLDVIANFEKPTKDKSEDAKLLPFFELKYPQTCHKICKCITELSPDLAYSVLSIKDPEILFCLKQLIEAKIINILDNDGVVRGERFDEYCKFVWHEVA